MVPSLKGLPTHLWFPMTLGRRCSVPVSGAKPTMTSWGEQSHQCLVSAQNCPHATSMPVKFCTYCKVALHSTSDTPRSILHSIPIHTLSPMEVPSV